MTAATTYPILPIDIDANARLFAEIVSLMVNHRLPVGDISVNDQSATLASITVHTREQVQLWADHFGVKVAQAEGDYADQFRAWYLPIAGRKVTVYASDIAAAQS